MAQQIRTLVFSEHVIKRLAGVAREKYCALNETEDKPTVKDIENWQFMVRELLQKVEDELSLSDIVRPYKELADRMSIAVARGCYEETLKDSSNNIFSYSLALCLDKYKKTKDEIGALNIKLNQVSEEIQRLKNEKL